MKKKIKTILKRLLPFTLALVASVATFAGCNNPEQKPVEPVIPNPGGEIVNPIEEKETALEIVSGVVQKANLGGLYDNAILSHVQSKYAKVETITSVNLQKDVHGKFTITANVKDENNQTKAVTFEYEGDTTMLCEKESNENIIAQILAKAEIEMDAELVKDSKASEQLKTLASAEVDLIKTQITALSNLEVTEKQEAQPQVEYVSVQSIVDEIWGDVDTDADIKAIAKYLMETKLPVGRVFEKLYAVDKDENKITCYVETSRDAKIALYAFSVEVEQNDLESFYELLKDKNEVIHNLVANSGININSDIEKNSLTETNLRTKLVNVKESYLNTITETKKDMDGIYGAGVFTPSILTEDQMQELGIENMNEFAEALQNNTKGQFYVSVEDWNIANVVETYVTAPSAESITKITGYNIYLLLRTGIITYNINVLNGPGIIAYKKTLNDSADISVMSTRDVVEYSDNAIVYDKEGERITDNSQVQTAGLYSVDVNGTTIGFYDSKKEKLL